MNKVGLALLSIYLFIFGFAAAQVHYPNGEWELLSLLNNHRSSINLPPLQMAVGLRDVARRWTQVLATPRATFQHNPNIRSDVTNAAPGWQAFGEIIAAAGSIGELHTAWLKSSEHKKIMQDNFFFVGYGVYKLDNKFFATADFVRGGNNQVACCGVAGAIASKYNSGNWQSVLGSPTTNELFTPDRVGRFNHFQKGSIYWSPNTGANVILGHIKNLWSNLGWETSFLGYPTTDELTTPDGKGKYNHFQGGSIYWTTITGAHFIRGNIKNKWGELGWEKGPLRYPTTDELTTPDGKGKFNHFEGGSIYWTQATGAHEVRGSIRSFWANLGYERSSLGYPISDELTISEGKRSNFQGGALIWNKSTNQVRRV